MSTVLNVVNIPVIRTTQRAQIRSPVLLIGFLFRMSDNLCIKQIIKHYSITTGGIGVSILVLALHYGIFVYIAHCGKHWFTCSVRRCLEQLRLGITKLNIYCIICLSSTVEGYVVVSNSAFSFVTLF